MTTSNELAQLEKVYDATIKTVLEVHLLNFPSLNLFLSLIIIVRFQNIFRGEHSHQL